MLPPDAFTYLRGLFAPEDSLLQQARRLSQEKDFPIGVTPETGKILHLLLSLMAPKKVLEIGTHAGCSTVWMARALGPEGHLYTIERSPDRLPLARQTLAAFERKDQVTLCEGWAREVLPTLESKGPFDVLFIDADKLNYLAYLEWAERHVRPGGLVIADDAFLFGAVYQETLPDRVRPSTRDVMRAFNERLADPEKYLSILVPTEHGLLVAKKLGPGP